LEKRLISAVRDEETRHVVNTHLFGPDYRKKAPRTCVFVTWSISPQHWCGPKNGSGIAQPFFTGISPTLVLHFSSHFTRSIIKFARVIPIYKD
jgi:hypothetical protein